MLYKSDQELKSEILFQLGWDSRVNQTDIGVSVRNGVATLSGVVDSYARKITAQKATHRVAGILDVVNQIEVRLPKDRPRSDSDIAQAVRQSLEWNVLLPAERIHSTVSSGWVTLEGDVQFYRERIDAERTVSRLAGIRGITNRIRVCACIDPERLKFLIEDVLERRADRHAHRLSVAIDHGAVSLTGAVASLEEKNAIIGAVSHAPGVTAVHDCLYVEPAFLHGENLRH